MSVVNRGTLPKNVPSPDKEWEHEYAVLYDKHVDLKKKHNKIQSDYHLLQVEFRKLESAGRDLKIAQNKQDSTGGIKKNGIQQKEENDLIASLQSQISKYKSQNNSVTDKNKQLVDDLEKKKREISVLKRLQANQAGRPKTAPSNSSNSQHNNNNIEIIPGPNPRHSNSNVKKIIDPIPIATNNNSSATDSNLLEVARKYKARLTAAEEQLDNLQKENSALKYNAASNNKENSNHHHNTPTVTSVSTKPNDNDNLLRDANWRLQQLQTQYDFLVSKTSANSSKYKQSESQIEEYSQKVRDLRRALEDLRYEKETTDAKASRADDLEELVSELRAANRSLEEKISRLCESPFIGDAFGQQESRMRYENVVSEIEELRTKNHFLQESLRTKHAALEMVNKLTGTLREEKAEAERKAEEMQNKYREIETNSTMLHDKLRLYSGEDGVDVEMLERALTLVKRRSEALDRLPFLEDPEGKKDFSLPMIRRKLEEVQIINLKLTEEVERMENMLKLQSGINRDLHKELESLVNKRDKDKRELSQRADDFEELSLRRLKEIHSLQAQVRELIYGVANKGKSGANIRVPGNDGTNLDNMTAIDNEADNALLYDFIDENKGDLMPDENLLEVWVKGAALKEGILSPGSSAFVVIDFFDYDSQTTSLLSGLKPVWDFATTYKINVDDFLLRYIATDVITLELNMACQGDFTMLARCNVPLSSLLRSKPIIRLKDHPMISVNTGEIVAHINIEMRLALPVSELYRLFLERHPADRKQIEDITSKRILETAGALERANNFTLSTNGEDESRLYNELEITIMKAIGLPESMDGLPPTSYVHFQLLGHPDKFTNPVSNSIDPSYNESFVFPMVTNDQQIRLLQRSKLQLTIIDMKGEECDDENEGLIGEVFILLAEIAEGKSVIDCYSIKDKDGRKMAGLQISMRWKHTYRMQRELGPRALSGIEVELLISSFCPGDVNEGIIDYRSFCRFIDPPVSVRKAMGLLKEYSIRSANNENTTSRDIFSMLFNDSINISEDVFVEKMMLTQIAFIPEEIHQLFNFIDLDDDARISLDQFLAVLNLDEVNTVPTALQEKLRNRIREVESKNISPLQIFKDADQWGPNGLVTRMEFKGVLKRLGFQLPDESAEPPSVSSIKQYKNQFDNINNSRADYADDRSDVDNNELNDTLGSNDEVLIAHDSTAPSRAGIAGGSNASNKERLAYDKKQREIFEERKNDMQIKQQGSSLIDKHIGVSVDVAGADRERKILTAKSIVKPQSHSNLKEDPFGVEQHRVALSSNGAKFDENNISKSINIDIIHQNKHYNEVNSSSNHIKTTEAENYNFDIIAAESTIRGCILSLQGVKPVPNILGGFQIVDFKRTGIVNRKQFAHVMKQFEDIVITPFELRSCMEFFDRSTNGVQIDYNSFVRMCFYQQPEPIPALNKISKMIFPPNTVLKFRSYDSLGSGFIKRADMLRVLADIGQGQIGNTLILSILELFETKVDGQVHYGNFVQYVRENFLNTSYDIASQKLFSLLTNNDINDETNMREWFRKVDRNGNGRVNSREFAHFLENFEIHVSKEVISSIYMSFVKDNSNGILINDFITWCKRYPETVSQSNYYTSVSIAELQRKANKFMIAIASNSVNLDIINMSYKVYDWSKASIQGTLSKPLFINATKRAGFPFTANELRMLASEFSSRGDNNGVSYRKFLSWATPAEENMMKLNSSSSSSNIAAGADSTKRTTSSIVKILENALQRGLDLLSIFARYDNDSSGRITSDEFCAALSEIGLSSATKREALDCADRFKASAGDFILYRRIVTELLRQIDDVSGAADIDIIDVIRSIMLKENIELIRLSDIFDYYDRKGNGKIRSEDIGTIFEEAGIQLKRQEQQFITDKYCIGGSDWIQYSIILKKLDGRLKEFSNGNNGKPNILSEEIVTQLRDFFEKLVLRGKDFRNEFDKFDDNFSGSVLQSDFRDVLQDRLRAGLSSKEIDILEKQFRDKNDPRRVNHVKFITDVHSINSNKSTVIWEIAEELRQKIRRKCDYLTPGELRRPYKHFARRTGASGVGLADFALSIRDLGMRIASDQEELLFSIININGNKQFNYADFVVFVSDPQYKDVVWKLRRLMARSKVSDREVISSLQNHDTNSSGLITARQFLKSLKTCNIELTEYDVSRLMYQFDTEENQRFDVEKFSRFLRGYTDNDEEDNKYDKRFSNNDLTMSVRKSMDVDNDTQSWNSLKKRIEAKLSSGFTSSEVFAIFDIDRQGTLDLMSLQQGSRELGVTLSRGESRAILRRMGLLVGGVVTKTTLFEAFEIDIERTQSRYKRGDDRDDRRGSYDMDDGRNSNKSSSKISIIYRKRTDLKDEIINNLEKIKYSTKTNIDDLLIDFKVCDRHKVGFLERGIFAKCLIEFGFKLTSSVERDIVDSLGDGEAGIDYIDFVAATKAIIDRSEEELDEVLSNLRSRIVKELNESNVRLDDLFARIDRDGDEELELDQIEDCLKKIRIPLDKDEARRVSSKFCKRGTSTIKYMEFARVFSKLPQKTNIYSPRRDDFKDESKSNDNTSIITIIDRIRYILEARSGSQSNIARLLKSSFVKYDDNNDGRISYRDFKLAISDLKIDVERHDAEKILAYFDKKNNGYILFDDFMSLIEEKNDNTSRNNKNSDLNKEVGEIFDTIRRNMEDNLGSESQCYRQVKETFEGIDYKYTGKIDKVDFNSCMKKLKIHLRTKEIDSIFDIFDGLNGTIEYKDFIKLLGFRR
jgi:Ca2+-binding EF-hand superfamily protein